MIRSNKRARTSDSYKPETLSKQEFTEQLKAEQERIQESGISLPHCLRFIETEIERMSQADENGAEVDPSTKAPGLPWEEEKDGTGIYAVIMPDEVSAEGKTKSAMKVFMPETTPDGRGSSTRGRLLGPQGATLRQLQTDTKCKMSLKGKGSLKTKDGNAKEEALLSDPQYAHLNEDFHLLIEYDSAPQSRNQSFTLAYTMIRSILLGGSLAPGQSGIVGLSNGSFVGVTTADYACAQAAAAAGQITTLMIKFQDTTGGVCKSEMKMFVPERTSLGCSRGKLLGPRGSMLKQLTKESGCRFTIRGKGSVKVPPGETEETMSNNPVHAHLKETLHVLVEYDGLPQKHLMTMQNADMLLRALLTPAGDNGPGQYQVSQYEVMRGMGPPQQQSHHYAPPPSQPSGYASVYPPPQAAYAQQSGGYGYDASAQHHGYGGSAGYAQQGYYHQ